MNLPPYLVQQIREGKVVLFLGAGASMGAIPTGTVRRVPDAKGLGVYLSDKFLGGQDKDKSLSIISEYAINDAADLVTVQEEIRNLFQTFEPAEFHKKISAFKWAALATTNYDLLVEHAYEKNQNRLQSLVPVVKTTDKFEAQLKELDRILYLKLHGCISRASDQSIPLILTIDQYITHRRYRERLFDRFKSFASDFPVVFVGYRLEDPDLRLLLSEIAEEGISRPRYYVVCPGPNERDVRIWEQRKITAIDGTFEDFLNQLESEIPTALRALQRPDKDHAIETRFIKHQKLSPATLSFLKNDIDYLHADFVTESANPRSFYKGASYGWSSIAGELDASRNLTDTLLSDIIISDDSERPQSCDFYLIKAYAGAGKSVLLRRLAWEAANTFGKLCLVYRLDTRISIDPIQELAELTGERLFLFVDRPATRWIEIDRFIKIARQKRLNITVICSERTNEWHNDCQNLNQLIDEAYELRSLAPNEIDRLLEKLKKHGQLGSLAQLSEKDQKAAFLEYANRQLLVALYEVTSGLSFEQIIFDEYRNIVPDEARQMYLVVCSLNRLGVPVRAGIIKRLTNISFTDFKDRFFKPLESIVMTEEYKPALDIVYRARHPWIAEKVFERALPNSADRFDLYIRLLEVLDIGYTPDRQAFRELIRAKSLMKLFSDPTLIRQLYEVAGKHNAENAYQHQQLAIFEMSRANANFDIAYAELKIAQDLAPHDKSIKHSFAELEFSRAQATDNRLEREKHFRNAKDVAVTLTGKYAESAHGYVTVARVGIESLSAALRDEAPNEITVTSLVKEIENYIQSGLEHFPEDEFLLSAESNLAELLNKEDLAVSALERAFKTNSASPFIARSLSRLYEKKGDLAKSKMVLEDCLKLLPGDKAVNAAFARCLTDHYADEGARAALHWRRSFTDGDTNYSSQFWYARQLFINGNHVNSRNEFQRLRTARVSSERKHDVRGVMRSNNNTPIIFTGTVDKLEPTYGSFKVDLQSFSVPISRSRVDATLWAALQRGQQVEFQIGFNFHGPAAILCSIKEN
ncbi:SIR2 family protein [Undibacterium sp. FT79W]|uniref:P-loop NTPase n=1 Tax=Undibacterium sp. FT79W TaxID=2762296 RepID=UPI00164BEF5E|nr:SIR2 family protein [Undibacterium sp. FT79W]MBC3876647.1 SIR2 family protein [Undibacterium sp. FT79W]